MSLLLADDSGTLNMISVNIDVTFTPSVQKLVKQNQLITVTFAPVIQKLIKKTQSITVTFTVVTSLITKFFRSVNVTVAFTPSIQKLIKKSQSITVPFSVSIQKFIILSSINISTTFTVVATESLSFFRSFAINVIFTPFIDALFIAGAGVTSIAGTIRNIKARLLRGKR